MTEAQFPEFMTVEEIAAQMRVSKMTIYRHIHENRISYTRIGRHFRITTEEFQRIMREGVAL